MAARRWVDGLKSPAGTPGLTPGPTLGNEYEKTLPFSPWICC